ncbi:MAG: lactate racemase domain-containing protein, partial [Promethearchaeota archaeon]
MFLHNFSDNIDIYHAKEPMRPLENARNAIKEAIENPIESKNLDELITSASKISICFDDISVPLPPMKKDVRAIAAEVIVEKLTDIGVKKENIRFTCAMGLHRKCTPRELKHMLGKKIYNAFKSQIHNNDVSKKDNHVTLGKLTTGEEIRINKLAVEADLIIYLNITFTPLNGGWKSIIVGLGDFTTIIPHHSPEILKEGEFMDPANSRLHEMIWEMGRMIKDKLTIFTVEMVLNTRFY